jgi:hypothetical protein
LEGILLVNFVIPPETIVAYRATNYRVLSPTPFVLKVDQPSKPLQRLYHKHGAGSAAFITAWNPFSTRMSDACNEAAQTGLEDVLTTKSIAFIKGIGEDPAGLWPGEMSVLALGLSPDAAKSLGIDFKQNAIVWAGLDATPELILLSKKMKD